MQSHYIVRYRILTIIALCLAAVPTAVSKSNRPKPSTETFICGTSAERERNAVISGRYHQDRLRRELLLGRAPLAVQSTAAAFDSGDVAVIEDDGTIITQPNPFDL